jgi:hypothetical protein
VRQVKAQEKPEAVGGGRQKGREEKRKEERKPGN